MGIFVKNKNDSLTELMEEDKLKIETEKEEIEKEKKNEGKEKKEKTLGDKDVFRINTKVHQLLSAFKFAEANSYIYEETNEYNQDKIPEELMLKFIETANMSNIEDMLAFKDINGIVDTLNNFKDVDNFLVATLSLESTHRRQIIKSVHSINPVFNGGLKDLSKIDITDNYNDIEELKGETIGMKNIQKVYKHNFVVEGNRLSSYIAETDSGFKFIKISQSKDNELQYHTIKEWDKLFNN